MKEQILKIRKYTEQEILKLFGIDSKKEKLYYISHDYDDSIELKTEVLNE